MNEVHDMFGQPITPGCFVTYPAHVGYSSYLRVGKVLKVTKKKHEWRDNEEVRITVHGTEVYGLDEGFRLLSKAVALSFPSRMLVIPESSLPPALRDLFVVVGN